MRNSALFILGGLVSAAGCLAPFSWPDERHERGHTSLSLTETDHLTSAADFLDRGDDKGALPHLSAHVAEHPEAVMVRAYLAELCVRVGRHEEARKQFERVVADAQLESGPARGHLVHCHTRLMEIAEIETDEYSECLHRGIGLLLLVRKWRSEAERQDEAAAEQTLAKAAKSLRAAIATRQGDPRGNYYLSEVYELLGETSAARTARRVAQAGLSDPTLTPDERDRISRSLLSE